jgi:hypothetical protein
MFDDQERSAHRTVMRTFACFIEDAESAAPRLSFIVADSEIRARELVSRELGGPAPDRVKVTICEDVELLRGGRGPHEGRPTPRG